MKSEDFLKQISAVSNKEERNWLITQNLLDTLPRDLAHLIWAAAVPHWFNAEILTALHPELTSSIESLYNQLQSLPFVEPYVGRGHNIHESIRQLMLGKLWKERRREYTLLSQRVADYFYSQKQDTEIAIEYVYNLSIADSQKASKFLLKYVIQQGSSLNRDYFMDACKRMVLEHVNAGRQVESLSKLGNRQ